MNGPRLRRLGLVIFLAAGVIWIAANRGQFDMQQLQDWVGETGAWGPLLFMLICAVATILLVPASLFVMAGGVLFGPWLGTLYNLIGATLGAVVAFYVARYVASEWVARKSHGRVKQLIDGVEAEGWHFVAFVRLVPIFPFFLLNYFLGLTRINFMPYVLATFVCSIPGVGAFTYLGYVGREALGDGEALVQKSLIAMALLAVMFFLPRFAKRLHDRGKL